MGTYRELDSAKLSTIIDLSLGLWHELNGMECSKYYCKSEQTNALYVSVPVPRCISQCWNREELRTVQKKKKKKKKRG